MPSWSDVYDTKPYAPHAPIKPGTDCRMTPYELAAATELIGRWVATGKPNRPGAPAYAAPYYRRSMGLAAHDYLPDGPTCTQCPLPAGHPIHTTPEIPDDAAELDARVLGEREDIAA